MVTRDQSRRKPGWAARAAALGVVLAAGCGGGVPATSTPEIIADCFWSTDALAWVDTDADRIHDEDEPPLEGVQINFALTFYPGAATGVDGVAHLSGMHPGPCDPNLENSVIATAPEGYEATTTLTLPYTGEAGAAYEFGFRPSP